MSGCGLDDPVMPPPRWLVALRAWLRDKLNGGRALQVNR